MVIFSSRPHVLLLQFHLLRENQVFKLDLYIFQYNEVGVEILSYCVLCSTCIKLWRLHLYFKAPQSVTAVENLLDA